MSVSQNYPFNSALDFNLSNVEIVSSAAKLTLVSLPGQVFSQDFASASGFTYDNTKSEFVAGVLRQKDLSPTDSKIAAIYDALVDANWNKDGILTATVNGTPTIVGSKMQCHGVHGVRYATTTYGQGAIKFKFTPNYTTIPASNVNLVGLHQTAGNQNRIILTHSPSGGLRITLNDSAGTSIHNATAIGGNPSIAAGTEYEVEINWDNVAGVIRLFWNGVLQGTLSPGAWSHSAVAGVLHVGADANVYNTSNGSFKQVVLFNAVQHTVGYTPGYTLANYVYSSNKVDLPNFEYNGIGEIVALTNLAVTEVGSPRYIIEGKYWNGSAWTTSDGSYSQSSPLSTVNSNLATLALVGQTIISVSITFPDSNTLSSADTLVLTHTHEIYSPSGYLEPIVGIDVRELLTYTQSQTEPGSTSIKVILKIDGVLKYWNGSGWVTSNGTGAQANTPAQINSNLASLDLGSNSTIHIRWLLETSLNTATPLLDDATIEYEFGAIEIEAATCIVYGYYKDIANNPVSGAQVRFTLVKADGQYSEAQNNIIEKNVTLTTDANGYFSTPLIRTSEYQNGGTYKVTITKTADQLSTAINANNQDLTFQVPDTTTKDITDLLPPA